MDFRQKVTNAFRSCQLCRTGSYHPRQVLGRQHPSLFKRGTCCPHHPPKNDDWKHCKPSDSGNVQLFGQPRICCGSLGTDEKAQGTWQYPCHPCERLSPCTNICLWASAKTEPDHEHPSYENNNVDDLRRMPRSSQKREIAGG